MTVGTIAAVVLFAATASGQVYDRLPLPQDWSHRHLIFSAPDFSVGAQQGAAAKRNSISDDPRWELQLRKRALDANVTSRLATDAAILSLSAKAAADRVKRRKPEADPQIHRDWSNVMGGAAGVGRAGTFPAKYGFDIGTADCVNDFVVFTTASSGATGSGAFATRDGSFSANAIAGDTVTITNGTRVLTLTASASVNTGLNFQNGSASTSATNLALAIARNGGAVGVTATSPSAGTVRVTAITQGAGANSIALADNNPRFAWAGATLAGGSGTAGQPTLFALNQLYSSCGSATQAVPATLWSYTTGAAAFAETSPVLSIGGDQVAFVQRTGTVASLVLLKWSGSAPGTVGAPTVPTSVAPASYRACTAPCMAVLAFSGNPNDTNSSPYYDYANDIIYVGADNGTLHKFTGVFNGTPAEQTTGGFPATVSSGNVLSSPVYDSVSGLVFVGSRGGTNGGRLHSVNASGTVVSSGQLAGATSTGVSDAPIVDSTAGRVYVFVANDGSNTANSPTCYATATSSCGAVYQFVTNFVAGNAGSKVTIGGGINTSRVLYAGAFDSAYLSGPGTSPTGNLYVCGGATSSSPGSIAPTLWRIPIAANVMNTAQQGPQLVSAANTITNGICSPMTEVTNGSNDYVFVSVPENGNDTGCTGACVYMYNLTGLTWNTAAVATSGIAAPGGASGIVIDNTVAGGGSQVYYATRTSPGNAVQASQAALQ